MKPWVSLLVILLLLCPILQAQSVSTQEQLRTAHLQGTVSDPLNGVIPKTKVTFQSDRLTKTVIADSKGIYKTDLPMGAYAMTAQADEIGHPGYRFFEKYRRPMFRVVSPSTLIMNVTLYPARMTCDIVVSPSTLEDDSEDSELYRQAAKNACGGEDLFLITPEAGTPFQLYVRYLRRSSVDGRLQYSGDRVATNVYAPVRLEYNFLTLEAERVEYDSEHHRIEAKGHVVITDESGNSQIKDSIILRFSDAQAIPIQ